jgi:ligand-binding sensor domain-containing protein
MNKHFNLYLFLLVFISSCASHERPTISEIPQVQTVENLTPDLQIADYIRHIYQDKNGNFWFGTNNFGAAHYNGDSIVYFSNRQGFDGSQITGITEDSEKNIWFATDRGIVKYDWSITENGKKKFTNYSSQEIFGEPRFWSIFVDSKGVIWAGAGNGVYRYDGETWSPFESSFASPFTPILPAKGPLSDVTVWTVCEQKNGMFWFGTNGNGAVKYDGKTFTQFTELDGLTDNSVDHILEDSNGNIWFGTRYGGVSIFDGDTFTNYTENDSIGNNEVCVIYEDRAGNIWLSSEGFGVYRFNGESFTNFSTNEGLGVKAVQTIFEDKEGRLWVGGGGGLFQFDGERFFNVTKDGPWE